MAKYASILMTFALALLGGCDAPSPAQPSDDLAVPETPLFAKGGNLRGLVRTSWPSQEDPGPPFYGRIHQQLLLADGGWAAIPFYRHPDCVPADFNLLAFFDVPAAFGCTLTVHGFSLWHGEVGIGAPHMLVTTGAGAVLIWFMPEEAVLEAMEDGVLTTVELAAIPGLLIGYATQFNEVLQPEQLPPEAGGGGNPIPKLMLNAGGTLEDGRQFSLHHAGVAHHTRSIRIRFW
jgi:hypothetical protein